MRRTVVRTAPIGAVAVAALVLGVGSAQAAPTFTVTAGGAPAGTVVGFGGASTGSSPQLTWKDTTTSSTLTCVSGSLSGSTRTGSGQAGTGLATISGPAFVLQTCAGPFNLRFLFTGSGTWRFAATAGSTTGASGSLTGIVLDVDAGSSCKLRLTGSLPATYTDSTRTFRLTGTSSPLTVSNVVGGCFGAWKNGDATFIAGSFTLSAANAAYDPIAITSP